MIVRYDRRPYISVDEKLQSLAASIQLALNEITTKQAELEKSIEELSKAVEELSNN